MKFFGKLNNTTNINAVQSEVVPNVLITNRIVLTVDNNVSRNYYFHSLCFNNKTILLIHNMNGLSLIAFANIIQIIIIHSTVAVGVPIFMTMKYMHNMKIHYLTF